MRIAVITPGAAGMFCGSCLRDNTLVTALSARGHDALLVPTYTPITTDEPLAKSTPIFLGGVNVYLQEKVGLFRHTPRWFDQLFDNLKLLRWAGRFASRTDYSKLGKLTLSMLRGDHGHQRKEVIRLAEWLKTEVKPDVILLSNVLLSGIVPTLTRMLNVPIAATLQGDDIFLNALPEKDKSACIQAIRENTEHLAGIIATSYYYADSMATDLNISRTRITVIPPGIQTKGHGGPRKQNTVPTVGFFARIAPEKGFHNLVDGFIHYRQGANSLPAKLRASGWLGEQHKGYLAAQQAKLDQAKLLQDFEYVDSPLLADKIRFMNEVDLLSVPTDYREPKGLYVLEAWANGLPVLLPDHGCFTELINDTGGGVLVPPGNTPALAAEMGRLFASPALRSQLGDAGRTAVADRYTAATMAVRTEAFLQALTALAPALVV